MGAEENPVVTGSLRLLELYGIDAWRNNAIPVRGRRFIGKKGRGDILGITRRGRFVNVECKRPGEEGRPEQVEFVDEVNRRGGLGVIVGSVEELYRYLESRLSALGEL